MRLSVLDRTRQSKNSLHYCLRCDALRQKGVPLHLWLEVPVGLPRDVVGQLGSALLPTVATQEYEYEELFLVNTVVILSNRHFYMK